MEKEFKNKKNLIIYLSTGSSLVFLIIIILVSFLITIKKADVKLDYPFNKINYYKDNYYFRGDVIEKDNKLYYCHLNDGNLTNGINKANLDNYKYFYKVTKEYNEKAGYEPGDFVFYKNNLFVKNGKLSETKFENAFDKIDKYDFKFYSKYGYTPYKIYIPGEITYHKNKFFLCKNNVGFNKRQKPNIKIRPSDYFLANEYWVDIKPISDFFKKGELLFDIKNHKKGIVDFYIAASDYNSVVDGNPYKHLVKYYPYNGLFYPELKETNYLYNGQVFKNNKKTYYVSKEIKRKENINIKGFKEIFEVTDDFSEKNKLSRFDYFNHKNNVYQKVTDTDASFFVRGDLNNFKKTNLDHRFTFYRYKIYYHSNLIVKNDNFYLSVYDSFIDGFDFSIDLNINKNLDDEIYFSKLIKIQQNMEMIDKNKYYYLKNNNKIAIYRAIKDVTGETITSNNYEIFQKIKEYNL